MFGCLVTSRRILLLTTAGTRVLQSSEIVNIGLGYEDADAPKRNKKVALPIWLETESRAPEHVMPIHHTPHKIFPTLSGVEYHLPNTKSPVALLLDSAIASAAHRLPPS